MRKSERKVLCKRCLKKIRRVEALEMKNYRKELVKKINEIRYRKSKPKHKV